MSHLWCYRYSAPAELEIILRIVCYSYVAPLVLVAAQKMPNERDFFEF
jgi:hypothetical protein